MTAAAAAGPAAPFATLPGWEAEDHAAALAAFARAAGFDTPFRALAAEAARTPPREARAFLEAAFAPAVAEGPDGLLTGYDEPTLPAARAASDRFSAPVHRLPPPGLRAVSRAEVRRGALAGCELFWVEDAVDAFFLETQGSGRLRLGDGAVVRVGYAGKNGRPWRSPGRMLVEAGEIAPDAVTADAVKAWLRRDVARGLELLDRSEAVVYFAVRDLAPEDGPLGALGAPLTPGRSAAVDPAFHPLGGLLWLDAATREGPLRRLVAAQDVGGAIRGPHRADLFCGWDAEAGRRAGALLAPLRLTPLAPRGLSR